MRSWNRAAIRLIYRLTAVAVFGAVSGANADVVFVSGNVSGIWSADSVIVTDSILIPAGETLTIEPGVDVLFTGYYKFQILQGAVLHAVGTESDTIRFLPFTQGDGTLGLDFLSASSQSILEYCYISDALTSAVQCVGSDITIRNCLIENNEAPTGSQGGGGIELLEGSNPIIENNIIRNNYSTGEGGGIYCRQSSPVISGNIIEGNTVGYYGNAAGGGIACLNGSNPQILGNRIAGNEVHPTGSFSTRYGYGGGIYISNSTGAVLSSNIITGNLVGWEPQTETYGGGIYLFNADAALNNNVIANNSAGANDGGGIYVYGSFPTLVNNTIAFNAAGNFGGAIYADFSDIDIVNSILYFNQDSTGSEVYENGSNVNISYSNISGAYPGIGNIDVAPSFRDPFGGDFHLQDSLLCGDDYYSACIDAGSPDYADSLIDCSFGRGTAASDMGAYGGGQLITVGVFDDATSLPVDFIPAYNYPNPFNAGTTIEFSLPEELHITIEIYDILGKKLDTLVDRRETPGVHTVTWRADDVPSGVYLYRIQAGDRYVAATMTLIK